MSDSEQRPPRESIGLRRRREAAERVAATLGREPLIVGLDVGSRTHHAWVRTRETHLVETFEVRHSREGVLRLHEKVAKLATELACERIVVGMEPTGHWWKNVSHLLTGLGVRCVLVNSLGVYHDRRIKHLKRAKGDRRDSELIAGIVARGDFMRAALETDEVWIRMRALAQEHEDLLDLAASTRQRILAALELVLPEYLAVFADPLAVTSRAVLRLLGLPAREAPASIDEVTQRLDSATVSARDGRRVVRSKVRALVARLRCAPSFGVDTNRACALARTAREVARHEHLEAERQAVSEELVALYATLPVAGFLDTVPHVGPLHHALLLGYLGDPRRYDRASCLISRAGCDPQENSSGIGSGPTAISRRGHGRLREVLTRIVMALRLHVPHYRAVYAHLRRRTGNALTHSQAMVAIGNRYLRMVYRLCVDGASFSSERLEGGAGPRDARSTR